MIKFFSFFLLASSLLFSGCECNSCNNSDLENGPRDGESPKYTLSLGEGVKGEELNVNQPIPLVLRDESFAKHPSENMIRIVESKLEKGTLHLLDAQGKIGEEIDLREVELKDGSLSLFFVPAGKAGKNEIDLKVAACGSYFKANLDLDLKSIISLEVPEEVKTSKPLTAYLKINAAPEEEYTLKSVKIDSYPVEIFYDNGEAEGIWAEIKPVQLGDKFKGGDTELSLKLYGVHDKLEAGPGIFEPVERAERIDKRNWQEHPRVLELVLVDSKGNEYSTKTEIKVEDISWDFDLEIDCSQPINEAFGFGGSKKEDANLKVNFKNDSGDGKKFKVLSFKANDGTAVSLVEGDFISEYSRGWGQVNKLVGFKPLEDKNFVSTWSYEELNTHLNTFQVMFYDMQLQPNSPATILTLKVEGPEGVVKSASCEVDWVHRELILYKRIARVHNRANWWTMELSSAYNRTKYEAEDKGKEAIAFLEEVKVMMAQVGNYKVLATYLQPSTVKEMKDVLEAIEGMKKFLGHLNSKFGFTFVSPI